MSDYVPVPVYAARKIAHEFAKDVVVIVAVDGEHGQIHTTTYGKDARDKINAAELGPILAAAAGGFTPASKPFEDFRDAAESAEKYDRLHAAGCVVLRGLNARIDAATKAGNSLPVFDGIAELHSALGGNES